MQEGWVCASTSVPTEQSHGKCALWARGNSGYESLLFPGSALGYIPCQRAADPFLPRQRSLAALTLSPDGLFGAGIQLAWHSGAVHPAIPLLALPVKAFGFSNTPGTLWCLCMKRWVPTSLGLHISQHSADIPIVGLVAGS